MNKIICFKEGLIHWSNLVGGSHSRNFTMWNIGDYASLGLKELAEFGIIRTYEAELKNYVIQNLYYLNKNNNN